MKQLLTVAQKERFKRLETGLREACAARDLDSAKSFAAEIQSLARATQQDARWLSNLNLLCEAAIECEEYNFAILRLESVVVSSNKTTRIRIEAYALLAVAHIRINSIDEAKKHIRLAINNIRNIKSEQSRTSFYENLVLRLEEEAILSGARLSEKPKLDIDEVQSEAVKILVSNEGEAQILARMGNSLPDHSIELFNDIRNSTLLQIPHQERLCLPPPNVAVPHSAIGKKAYSALKRVLWITLCDRDDELYQAWSNCTAILYDKKMLTGAVVAALMDAKVGSIVFVSATVAYLIKIGCRTFCEAFAPESIMKKLNK